MKKQIMISVLGILWALLLIKSILAMQSHDLSPTAHYYGEMLRNTWQGQFNFDLWIHTVVLACWIFFRENSKVVGVICGLATIYFGALFSLLYLILAFIRAKSDSQRHLKDDNVILT